MINQARSRSQNSAERIAIVSVGKQCSNSKRRSRMPGGRLLSDPVRSRVGGTVPHAARGAIGTDCGESFSPASDVNRASMATPERILTGYSPHAELGDLLPRASRR
jgi:hypothetical protein